MKASLIPVGKRFGFFNDLDQEMKNLMSHLVNSDNEKALSNWNIPQVNLSETDNEYEIHLDMPGMKPDEFDVELKHGDLWVTGERKEEKEEKGRKWLRVERQYGQFQRVIKLTDEIDPENIDAQYKDGVLQIKLQKVKTAATKHIDVKF